MEIIKQLFIGIWILSIIGALSVLPYAYFIGLIPESTSYVQLVLMNIINSAIMYGIICWISYLLLKRVDLQPFKANTIAEIVYPGILPGIFVGLTIVISNKLFFQDSVLGTMQHPPFWTGLIASMYGAINEEVLCRLFLLTLIYFILSKLVKNHMHYRSYLIWISICVVAIIFGIGHLPAAFKIISPSTIDIIRILLLNGIAGIVFGWLYYKKGFWTGVTAHFIADIIIHVLLIF